jgi:hypothetical protein
MEMVPMPSSRRGWNETAAKFKTAYGLKVQGEDRLGDPAFTGCDSHGRHCHFDRKRQQRQHDYCVNPRAMAVNDSVE